MTKSMKRIHTRNEIAAALAKHYSAKLNGKVWSYWDKAKRAYAIQGENLPPHPDLKAQYPNGWSMLDYIKPAEAHKILGLEALESKRILSVTVRNEPDTCANGNPSNYKFCRAVEREAAFLRGDFNFVGISVEALVKVSDSDLTQMIHSGGLWGIESDSHQAYLDTVVQDELTELRGQLHAIGFSQRAITAAFKDVVRK